MKERFHLPRILNVICAIILAALPVSAIAQALVPADAGIPVIITEVQTGGPSAGDEFIELFNVSDAPVDITGWQVRYVAASGLADATALVATVAAADATPILLASHAYYVLHTSTVALPEGVAGQVYSANLSKTDKTVALYARDQATCRLTVQDAVAWESATGTTLGEGPALAVPAAYVNGEKLVLRQRDAAGLYVDTDNNAHDFRLGVGTPGADNPGLITDTPAAGAASSLAPVPITGCTPAPEEPPTVPPTDPPDSTPPEDPPASTPPGDPSESPAGDPGAPGQEPPSEPPIEPPASELLAPELTELLPNPGAPHTDAADEYVELYNPNDAAIDLSGYTIEAGTTTKYHYTMPAGTMLVPRSYRAFFAADTHLTLANGGGQVRLMNSLGTIISESAVYGAAADDQAWALVGGTWQWTSTPTPNAANPSTPIQPPGDPEPQAPPSDPGQAPSQDPPASGQTGDPPAASGNDGLLPPQLTELLPNPGTPKTDEQDEFIELYNPNDTVFNLSGYTIEVGLTTKHRYVFPADTTLEPHAYGAFFSADTGLALSNSGSQVRLIDPHATVISQTAQYGTAKDNQAWAFINGTWQWTAAPTPNAANVLQAAATPPSKAAKGAATKTTQKKTTAAKTKGATTKAKTKSSVNQKDSGNVAIEHAAKSSGALHPGVLAAIAASALLYGAYEYRRDLANKIHQFRSNRAARTAARKTAEGR